MNSRRRGMGIADSVLGDQPMPRRLAAAATARADRTVAIPNVSRVRPPGQLSFDLSSLGWKAFQDLCGSILRQILGQTVLGFASGRDMGRDWAFEGKWRRRGRESYDGQLVVQCKFHEGGGLLKPTEIDPELKNIAALSKAGLCDTYVLMTNLRTSSATSAAIGERVLNAGARFCLVLGGGQIDTYLREEPRLRALVPRVYGLGDLSEILDDRAYEQARALLASMNEEMRKFVVTAPYGRSIDALNRHGFVLLLGAPAAGKSMIASALAMAAVDQWGLPAVRVDAPEMFRTHWNPHDRHQFFWVDDAFGTTQYQLRLADDWNRILPQLRAAIAGGTRIVMTSRDYIWRAATRDLKLSDFEPLEKSHVVIDVHELSTTDKQQILYNHLKFGDQPQEFRSAVKPFLVEAARADPFLPEVARRFGSTRFTQDLDVGRYAVRAFFTNPVSHLRDVITKLDADGRAALAFVYIAGGRLARPVSIDGERERALQALGSTLAGVTESLEELRGSLVSLVSDSDGTEYWTFQHPTIGEAFRSIVQQDRQFFPLYLGGMSTYSLLAETTCGDRGVDGAVIVDEADWPIVVRRLAPMDEAYELTQRDTYLVQRTTCEFLKTFMQTVDVFSGSHERLRPRLAVRLKDCGLLPEQVRVDLTDAMTTALIGDLDGTILEADSAKIIPPDEFEAVIGRVRDELLPAIEDVIANLYSKYDGSAAPEDWLRDVYETLDALRAEFDSRSDAASVGAVDAAIGELAQLQGELAELYTPEPDWDDVDDDFRGWSDSTAFDVFADVDA